MAHDIFLSYSRQDVTMMGRVRDDLRAMGLTVWTDENLTPGTPSWQGSIEDAIENARCLVVLLSPDAKESVWVNREFNYAMARSMPIFPLLIRGDEATAIPFALIGWQFVDLQPNYTAGFHKLFTAIDEHFRIQHPTSRTRSTGTNQNTKTIVKFEDFDPLEGLTINRKNQEIKIIYEPKVEPPSDFAGCSAILVIAILVIYIFRYVSGGFGIIGDNGVVVLWILLFISFYILFVSMKITQIIIKPNDNQWQVEVFHSIIFASYKCNILDVKELGIRPFDDGFSVQVLLNDGSSNRLIWAKDKPTAQRLQQILISEISSKQREIYEADNIRSIEQRLNPTQSSQASDEGIEIHKQHLEGNSDESGHVSAPD